MPMNWQDRICCNSLTIRDISAQSQANSDKANIYAQAQKDAYNAFLQQQQWEQQQKQWQWEQDTWLKEFDLKTN